MGARGYYTYTQISAHNHETIHNDLLQLENTFRAFIRHSNNEVLRLANNPAVSNFLNADQNSPISMPILVNLDSVAYYSHDGHALAITEGANSAPGTIPKNVKDHVSSAPIAFIDCDTSC